MQDLDLKIGYKGKKIYNLFLSNTIDSMNSDEIKQITVRINGTLPDITTLGSEQISERASEVKKGSITNTSCSIITNSKTNKKFHVLIDVGQGIVNSIENGASTIGLETSIQEHIPNAILITHSHNDHINELPLIIERAISTSKKIEIFCTKECFDQIL